MVDIDTFLTILYVIIDDFCKASLPPERRPGPPATLSRSEVMPLALFGPWQGFGSERGFSRYAQRHLRVAFPQLPTREQCKGQMRPHHEPLVAFFLHLVQLLAAQHCPYEALDSAGIPTRDAKQRGAGWVPGLAEIGWSNRRGWYEGFHLLLAVNPVGGITGVDFGPASTKDQPLADTFFALRRWPQPGLSSVGAPALGPYVVDKGSEGQVNHVAWWQTYEAQVLCPPKRNSKTPWPKALRRWRAGIRQSVDTVYDKFFHTLRLDRERPHDLSGFQARLATKIALYNFCIWLNEQLGQPRLAFKTWWTGNLMRFHTKRFRVVWNAEPPAFGVKLNMDIIMTKSDWDYRGLAAECYDLWFGEEPFWDQAFFHQRLSRNGGIAQEIACGTGRLLVPFLRDGLAVEGIDASAEMLEMCRHKATQVGATPILYQQLMQDLDLNRQYHTLFIPACSFQILAEREEAFEALQRFRTHLEPGGELLLTLAVPWRDFGVERQWRLRRSGVRPADGATVLIHEATVSDRVEQLQHIWMRHEVFHEGRLVQTQLRTHRLRWYYKHEFVMMLESAGFREIVVQCGYTDSVASDPDVDLVFMGKR